MLHRQATPDRRPDDGELSSAGPPGPSRRQFLQRVGLGGLIVTIGPAVLPVSDLLTPAGAATAKLSDTDLATFAAGLELAAAAAYGKAMAKLSTPAVVQATTAFAAHHTQHSAAIAPFAKGAATGVPNPVLLQTMSDQIHNAAGESGTTKALFDMENAIAATYLALIGEFAGRGAIEVAASILPVESQHAAVLGAAAGVPQFVAQTGATDPTVGSGYVPPFVTQDLALDPSSFANTTTTATTAAPAASGG